MWALVPFEGVSGRNTYAYVFSLATIERLSGTGGKKETVRGLGDHATTSEVLALDLGVNWRSFVRIGD